MSGKGKSRVGIIAARPETGSLLVAPETQADLPDVPVSGIEPLVGADERGVAVDADAVWWLQCRRVRLLALACRCLNSDPGLAVTLADRLAAFCDAAPADGGDLRLECLSAVADLIGRRCMGGDPVELAAQFEAFALGASALPAAEVTTGAEATTGAETGGAAEGQS